VDENQLLVDSCWIMRRHLAGEVMGFVSGSRQFFGRLMRRSATPKAKGSPGSDAPENASSDEPVRTAQAEPLKLTQLTAAFAHMVDDAPPSSLATPSMMSIPERQFLFGLASRYYSGRGIIVDAGIFLGASTRCFGEGLRANPRYVEFRQRWQQPVVSFERAIVNPNMPPFFERHGMAFTASTGESFEAELRRNVEPVKDLVDLRIGDILHTAEINHPIEILFLDILKHPQVSVHTIRSFYPKLIAGRSVVIQQDYFYDRLPWIKTHQEILREYFDFAGEIGSSAIFLCTKEIPEAAVEVLATEIPAAEQLRLASIAMQRSADPSRRFMMALSKTRLVHKLHGRATARAYLDIIKGEFPEQVTQTQNDRLSQSLRDVEKMCVDKAAASRAVVQGRSTRTRPSTLHEF